MPTLNPADLELARHQRIVAKALLKGTVVLVLGAGANLCDREPDEPWRPGTSLPSGAELSRLIADEFDCEVADRADLVRVAQYAELTSGEGPLYAHLREIFAHEYPIPSLHRFIARLPEWMAARGLPVRYPLIVTTNYDTLMEAALIEAGVEFDVVRYIAKGRDRGRFVHVAPSGDERIITVPNAYGEVDPRTRTVLLKLHGTVAQDDDRDDSYVITEDHYIDYLARTDPCQLIPVKLLEKLIYSHLLFLGYGMRDWNLRVILHRIWSQRELDWTSWAVQESVDRLDEKLWRTRRVELCECRLADFVAALGAAMEDVTA